MKIYRNPEFRREWLIYGLGTLLCAVISFFLSPLCGLLVLLLGLFFHLVHLYFAKGRYAQITELSQSIDRILHGQETLLITDSDEGELSILNSEIRKMTVRLKEQSDRLKADKLWLTDAIADIFHQLRTPLTSMNLTVSLLAEEDLSFDRRIRLTRELKQQLDRMQWLAEALLKMSKIDAGTALFHSEPVSVAELVRHAAQPLLIPMELRGISFSSSVSDEAFTGDFSWTAEALGNLLKNCTEHTPEGGRISVAAAETALYTKIVVQDSGDGFDKDDLPHLFQRFYKGKNASAESIGIGLALVRMIVSAQNGTVKAENAPDGGARFVVRFYKSVV